MKRFESSSDSRCGGDPNPTNRGFGAAVNQGIAALNTDAVLVLNPDAIPIRGLDALERSALTTGVGAATGRLIGPDGRDQEGFNIRASPNSLDLGIRGARIQSTLARKSGESSLSPVYTLRRRRGGSASRSVFDDPEERLGRNWAASTRVFFQSGLRMWISVSD